MSRNYNRIHLYIRSEKAIVYVFKMGLWSTEHIQFGSTQYT